jgi:glycosyltransferase involved in cell wall biosynthesis
MRILIASDLHWPNINGVATFGRNLAYGLAAEGHDVLVIAPSQTGKKYEEIDRNHRVMRTSSVVFPFYQNFRISISPYREVKRIIEDFEPDVIHIQTPIGIGRAAVGCAKKMGIPLVATNHAMPENLVDNLRLLAPFSRPINYILKEFGARFYNNADFVTLPTEAAIGMLKGDSFHAPYMAISNGIDLTRFKPGKVDDEFYTRFGIPRNKKVVLYVGRLDAEKHVSILIRAALVVTEKHNDVHFVVVGKGTDTENLQLLVERLDLGDDITFTGRVEDEDLPLFHRVGNVFVMPSPVELQCLAMLESMASGSPVVAVNVGALYELCQDGRNGYLYELDDHEEMAGKLMTILGNDKLRVKMGKESLAIAKTHELGHTIAQFVTLYKHVIAMREAEKAHELVSSSEA